MPLEKNIKKSTGINGFGRFSLHLLKYWIDRYDEANFSIDYINSESLSPDKILEIVNKDLYLSSLKNHVVIKKDIFQIMLPSGKSHSIVYSQNKQDKIGWVGKPTIFLECSGKNTDAEKARMFLKDKTKNVIISASSENADMTLVYGYNHNDFTKNDKIISYGSCTVNAYVPLANFINAKFGIIDSDVNVIHNVPAHKYEESNTLERRKCTLQWSAPKLLPFVTNQNFKVVYTLVPYLGVSLIDYRFRLKEASKGKVIEALSDAMEGGVLKGLYKFTETDTGPEPHKFTPYSAVLVKGSLDLVGENLYIQAYFDNENSVNRYFDVVTFIAKSE